METKIENYFKEEELLTKEEIDNARSNISPKEEEIVQTNVEKLVTKLVKSKVFVQKCIDEGVSEYTMKLLISEMVNSNNE